MKSATAENVQVFPSVAKNGTEPFSASGTPKVSATPVKWHDDGRLTIEHPTWLNALGVSHTEFAEYIASQLTMASSAGGKICQRELDFFTQAVSGMVPSDHVEVMLLAQMASVHNATMTAVRRLANASTPQQHESYTRSLNQLSRTYVSQIQGLKQYRTKGQQSVTVKHVHVHEGGQAIVGNVTNTKETGGV